MRVLMIGDSLTQGWSRQGLQVWATRLAPVGAVNWGMDHDEVQHMRWRLQRSEARRLRPRVVVLLGGANNLGHNEQPERLASALQRLAVTARRQWPDARVLLISLLPCSSCAGALEDTNAILSRMAMPAGVTYVDVHSTMQSRNDELLQSDGLHLTAAGYAALADALLPAVASALQ